MGANGFLKILDRNPDTDPGRAVPHLRTHDFSFQELAGGVSTHQAIGSHKQHGTGVVINSSNPRPFTARGNYAWFRFRSVKTVGDGLVTIRGRRQLDDGSRDADPTNYDFDMGAASVDEVFVSSSRIADNVIIATSSSGGFDGTIDYGIVSPWNAAGAMSSLRGAESDFEPMGQVTENWLASWQIQTWRSGTSGGLTDIVPATVYRHNDSPFKQAEATEPGHVHNLEIAENFERGPSGVICTVAVKSIVIARLTLHIQQKYL